MPWLTISKYLDTFIDPVCGSMKCIPSFRFSATKTCLVPSSHSTSTNARLPLSHSFKSAEAPSSPESEPQDRQSPLKELPHRLVSVSKAGRPVLGSIGLGIAVTAYPRLRISYATTQRWQLFLYSGPTSNIGFVPTATSFRFPLPRKILNGCFASNFGAHRKWSLQRLVDRFAADGATSYAANTLCLSMRRYGRSVWMMWRMRSRCLWAHAGGLGGTEVCAAIVPKDGKARNPRC